MTSHILNFVHPLKTEKLKYLETKTLFPSNKKNMIHYGLQHNKNSFLAKVTFKKLNKVQFPGIPSYTLGHLHMKVRSASFHSFKIKCGMR